jgi:hypothetical protein
MFSCFRSCSKAEVAPPPSSVPASAGLLATPSNGDSSGISGAGTTAIRLEPAPASRVRSAFLRLQAQLPDSPASRAALEDLRIALVDSGTFASDVPHIDQGAQPAAESIAALPIVDAGAPDRPASHVGSSAVAAPSAKPSPSPRQEAVKPGPTARESSPRNAAPSISLHALRAGITSLDGAAPVPFVRAAARPSSSSAAATVASIRAPSRISMESQTTSEAESPASADTISSLLSMRMAAPLPPHLPSPSMRLVSGNVEVLDSVPESIEGMTDDAASSRVHTQTSVASRRVVVTSQ